MTTIPKAFFLTSAIVLLIVPELFVSVPVHAFGSATPSDSGANGTAIQVHLLATSDQGTFRVKINWTSNDIGKENTFDIGFFDPDTGTQIEMARYDIVLLKDGKEIDGTQRLNQTLAEQKYVFSEAGQYTIKINNIEDLGESASFPVQVTPEFPAPTTMILTIAALGVVLVFATKLCLSAIS